MDTAVETVSKPPSECSDPELGDFIAFARAGGEVSQRGLGGRVRRALRLGFLRNGNCLLSIAALKPPNASYRSGVEQSSGVALPVSEYPYELGWVYTLPSARGGRYGQRISDCILAAADGHGVFATSRTDNGAMHITLERLGFLATGNPYLSRRGTHKLQLFVRARSQSAADLRPHNAG